MPTHKEMMELAVRVAEFLLPIHGIEKIGMFGSTARGDRKPSDVDLIVFGSEKVAEASLRGFSYQASSGHFVLNRKLLNPSQFSELELIIFIYGMGWREKLAVWGEMKRRRSHYALSSGPVDFVVLPVDPTADFLRRFEEAQPRPNFWRDAAKGYKEFDRRKGRFSAAVPPWHWYLKG